MKKRNAPKKNEKFDFKLLLAFVAAIVAPVFLFQLVLGLNNLTSNQVDSKVLYKTAVLDENTVISLDYTQTPNFTASIIDSEVKRERKDLEEISIAPEEFLLRRQIEEKHMAYETTSFNLSINEGVSLNTEGFDIPLGNRTVTFQAFMSP